MRYCDLKLQKEFSNFGVVEEIWFMTPKEHSNVLDCNAKLRDFVSFIYALAIKVSSSKATVSLSYYLQNTEILIQEIVKSRKEFKAIYKQP